MDTGTLISLLMVALVVVVLLFLFRAAGLGRRRQRLRPLEAESRDKYISDWDEIETKFLDSPEQAVREAEALVMSVLRERGHSLKDRELPREVQQNIDMESYRIQQTGSGTIALDRKAGVLDPVGTKGAIRVRAGRDGGAVAHHRRIERAVRAQPRP